MISVRSSPLQGLDSPHKQAVILGGAGAAVLTFAVLEMLRQKALHALAAQGYWAANSGGLYMRVVAGQTLSLTHGQSPAIPAITALLAGLTVLFFLAAAAGLDMHITAAASVSRFLTGLLFALLTGVLLLIGTLPPPGVTADLTQGLLIEQPGNYHQSLSLIAQFGTYTAGFGKHRHTEAAAWLYGGQRLDILPVAGYWEGQLVTTALTRFVTSGGQSLSMN